MKEESSKEIEILRKIEATKNEKVKNTSQIPKLCIRPTNIYT